MKPKMHTSEVAVDTKIRNETHVYIGGRRVPVRVAPIKLAQGTVFIEYFFEKPREDAGNLGFLYINPTASYKTNLYPDTVMEFSLAYKSHTSEAD